MHKLLLALALAVALLYAQTNAAGASNDMQTVLQKLGENITKINNTIIQISNMIKRIGDNITRLNNTMIEIKGAVQRVENNIPQIQQRINSLTDDVGKLRGLQNINSIVNEIRLWVFVAVALAAVSAVASIAALVASLRRRQLPQDVCA